MSDLSKFNGPFDKFVGIGNVMVVGNGDFALLPLAFENNPPIGMRIDRTELKKLIGALVAIQTDLERRAGPQVGYQSLSLIPLRSAEAKPTIEAAGSNGVALLLVAESKQPFAFALQPQRRSQVDHSATITGLREALGSFLKQIAARVRLGLRLDPMPPRPCLVRA